MYIIPINCEWGLADLVEFLRDTTFKSTKCSDCDRILSYDDVLRGQTTCDECFDKYYKRATPEERREHRERRDNRK